MCNGKSRGIYTIDIILKHLLLNDSLSIDYIKSKEIILNSLTIGLLREFMYNF